LIELEFLTKADGHQQQATGAPLALRQKLFSGRRPPFMLTTG
jgi:hypothetical protein